MHALALEGLGTRLAEFTCNNEKLSHLHSEVISNKQSQNLHLSGLQYWGD